MKRIGLVVTLLLSLATAQAQDQDLRAVPGKRKLPESVVEIVIPVVIRINGIERGEPEPVVNEVPKGDIVLGGKQGGLVGQ